MKTRLAAVGLVVAIGATPAHAEMHGLLLGFNAYINKLALSGSRNDALDLSQVLTKRGVKDITVVDEARGTRDQIEALWAAMVARAKPGDVLFFSFSGHGNRSPEKGEPKHTPDGFEKGFLLPAYDEATKPEEMLRDERLYDLFKAASDKGLKVVFVADACHSGAAVRGGPLTPPRFAVYKTVGNTAPPPPPDPSRVVRRPTIPNLSVYSAADERQEIREFPFDGQPRGVLSYTVARGLEGSAAGSNGIVTAGTLADYVRRNVAVRSENTQIPSTATPDVDLNLFGSATVASPAKTQSIAPLAVITLFADSGAVPVLTGAKFTPDRSRFNLAWNARGEVRNAAGDLVAYDVLPNQLQEAVDARRVLDSIVATMGQRTESIEMSLAAVGAVASDRYYTPGEKVQVTAKPSTLKFLTVVDLTANGTVQFLVPGPQNAPVQWPPERPWSSEAFKVIKPFGQDAVIVIRSEQPLKDLHAALSQMDNQRRPLDFQAAMRASLDGTRFALGLQSMFTCEKVEGDGSCAPPGSR